MHEVLDQHYRTSLDEPTPMLDSVSRRRAPPGAAKTSSSGSSTWRTARVTPQTDDTFYVDDRSPSADTWSTVANLTRAGGHRSQLAAASISELLSFLYR